MSPPDAPSPGATTLGWPRYSRPHAEPPGPPAVFSRRQASLPLPTPSSEPSRSVLARETWIAGSPSMFVPQPVAPTVEACSWPVEKEGVPAAAEVDTVVVVRRGAFGAPDVDAPAGRTETTRATVAAPRTT